MIRTFRVNDLDDIMQIWIDTNIKAHSFISKEYWINNYMTVKDILPQAEIYVYEDDSKRIDGFIGLTDNYIAGIFVRESVQSRGIGKHLLDYAKRMKQTMSLSVYQKNTRAVLFYRREQFTIQSENIDDNTGEKEYTMMWRK